MEINEFTGYDSLLYIDSSEPSDQQEQQIIEKEQKKENYKIVIDFYNGDSSIQEKNEAMDMIDRLNLNHKVKRMIIEIRQDNPIDQ